MDPSGSSGRNTPTGTVSNSPASLTLTLEDVCDLLCKNLLIAEPNLPTNQPFVDAAVDLFGSVAVEKALNFDLCDSVEDVAAFVERHQHEETWAVPLGTLNERMRVTMATTVFAILEESGRHSLDTVYTVVKNLIHRPDDEKVRTLRVSNEKLHKVIFSVPQAMSLLEFIGFQQATAIRKKPPFVEEKTLHFPYRSLSDRPESRRCQALYSMLDDLLCCLPPVQESPLVMDMVTCDPREETRDGRLTRACVADIHEHRLKAQKCAHTAKAYQRGGQGYVAKRPTPPPSPAPRESWWSQLFGSTKQIPPSVTKRHMTLSDIEQLRYDEAIGNMPRYADEYILTKETSRSMAHVISKYSDPAYLGRLALDRTNLFRGEQKLPPLRWNEAVYDIAREHAQQMADGRMPFSHEGFSQRAGQFPFYHMSAAENIAWNAGVSSPAEVAVNGWINSPGHRKNLLSTSNLCAIGVGMAGGRVYFTQLFARTPGALC